MATINYRFADGQVKTIEVSEEFAKEYANLEKEEQRITEREKKRRKHCISLELLIEKGIDFPDESTPDPLQELLDKETDKITLIELADFLTSRQKQIMSMYYENGYSKTEISEALSISKVTVNQHLEEAIKKILKKF